MSKTHKQTIDILKKEIEVSDTVNKRLRTTYEMLEQKQKTSERRYPKKRSFTFAAMAAITVLCAGSGVVYASVQGGFFEGMFGNLTKKSTPARETEIEDGKGGSVKVTIPSKEFVEADLTRAQELLGDKVTEDIFTQQIGDYTLNIQNFLYDKHSALMYFTVEREKGADALIWDDTTNLSKGAYFSDSSNFSFYIEGDKGTFGHENFYVDKEKSTKEKLYCYTYALWGTDAGIDKEETPQLVLDVYPCSRGEFYDTHDFESEEPGECDHIKTQRIDLAPKGQAIEHVIHPDANDNVDISPISMSINTAKILGPEKTDPFYIQHLEVQFKDGSNYIITDEEKSINNSGYVLGTDNCCKVAFNRLVDVYEISKVILNDMEFPVTQ